MGPPPPPPPPPRAPPPGGFGGSANRHIGNLDIAFEKGFGIVSQPEGYSDEYSGNYLYSAADGDYGSGQACKPPGMTVVGNNTIWTPTGRVTECGMSLAQWQAGGGDKGTTASVHPADSVVMQVARTILGM